MPLAIELTRARKRIGQILCDLHDKECPVMPLIVAHYFGDETHDPDTYRKRTNLMRVQITWLRKYASQNMVKISKANKNGERYYLIDRPDKLRELMA